MPTTTRVISLSDYVGALRRIAADVPRVIQTGLTEAGHRCVAYLQERSGEAAFDTGGYKRSWKFAVMHISGGCKLTLTNTHPASDVIERGRRPGSRMPPPKALEAWVRRKLKVSKAAAPQVAWAVAASIGRKGIQGKHVLEKAGDEIEKLTREEVARAFKEAREH